MSRRTYRRAVVLVIETGLLIGLTWLLGYGMSALLALFGA